MSETRWATELERAKAEGRLQLVPIRQRCGHIVWWSLILDEEPLEAVIADLEGWLCMRCKRIDHLDC